MSTRIITFILFLLFCNHSGFTQNLSHNTSDEKNRISALINHYLAYRLGNIESRNQQPEHFTTSDSNPQHEHSHQGTLHFSHPLIAENISPDTKIRFNHDFESIEGDTQIQTLEWVGEYAFHRSFSIEVGIPYQVIDPAAGSNVSDLGNMEVALKFANFAFEDSGVLLGYGLEFGLPTGSEEKGTGSNNIVELEPFFNIGYKKGPLELVSFAKFGIPANLEEDQEVETEFAFNFSSLYHLNPSIEALLEFDGGSLLTSEEVATSSEFFVTPGIKIAPFQNKQFNFGTGLRIPVSSDPETEIQTVFSFFYHF